MRNFGFLWSDNWWIENGTAWFCAGEMTALFCVDMDSLQCKFVTRIPQCDFEDFRLYSYCMKYGDNILCLPNIGECIWCYDLKALKWKKIEVGNEAQIFVCRSFFRKKTNKIYFWHSEGNVFEINLVKGVLENEYHIPVKSNEEIGEYVLVENRLYCVLGRHVYCIDTDNEEVVSYLVSGAKANLYTICFDGRNFWLSGFCKEIYVWNPKQGIVRTIAEFPEQFGIYDFNGTRISLIDYDSFITSEYSFFYSSVSLGKYVWFIPYQTNEIIYIDRETYEIFILEIEREVETRDSLKMHRLAGKYLVEYIRNERFIGLYSFKNRCVFEIDTLELCIKDREYYLCNDAVLAIMREDVKYNNRKVLREYREMDRIFYSTLLKENAREKGKIFQDIGECIYNTLNK